MTSGDNENCFPITVLWKRKLANSRVIIPRRQALHPSLALWTRWVFSASAMQSRYLGKTSRHNERRLETVGWTGSLSLQN